MTLCSTELVFGSTQERVTELEQTLLADRPLGATTCAQTLIATRRLTAPSNSNLRVWWPLVLPLRRACLSSLALRPVLICIPSPCASWRNPCVSDPLARHGAIPVLLVLVYWLMQTACPGLNKP